MNGAVAGAMGSFGGRVTVALALAVTGSISLGTLMFVLPGVPALAAVSTVLATLYAIWLLVRSGVHSGRLLTAVVWLVACTALMLAYLPLLFHLVALAAMVWIVRALYCYSGILPALADIGVVVFSLMAGLWSYAETASPLLAFWSVFLVLAIFVQLPGLGRLPRFGRWNRYQGETRSTGSSDDAIGGASRFDRAQRDAELAVQKLTEMPT